MQIGTGIQAANRPVFDPALINGTVCLIECVKNRDTAGENTVLAKWSAESVARSPRRVANPVNLAARSPEKIRMPSQ